MRERDDYTLAALYARVSSDRQDVDLSVAAHLRGLEQFIGNDVARPLVSLLCQPGLNGPKSTAHEYLSFPLLLSPSNESS